MEQKNIQVEVQGKNVLPTPIKNLRELTTEVTQAGADATEAKELAEVNTEIVADKDYDTAKFSGMGRVNLQKNIIDGHNYLTQEMVSKPNTIYKIQYDYEIAPVTTGYIAELNQGVIEVEGHTFNYKVIAANAGDIITKESGIGNTTAILYMTSDNVWHNPHTPVLTVEDGWTIAIADVVGGSTAVNYNVTTRSITIPENCVLEFEGGSLSGGTLVGNGTGIQAELVKIFNTNAELSGEWNVLEAYPEWFGAKQNTESALAIQSAIDFGTNVKAKIVFNNDYIVNTPLEIKKTCVIDGKNHSLSTTNSNLAKYIFIKDRGATIETYGECNNLSISNIVFNNNYISSSYGIVFENSSISYISLTNIKFYNFINPCIYLISTGGGYSGQGVYAHNIYWKHIFTSGCSSIVGQEKSADNINNPYIYGGVIEDVHFEGLHKVDDNEYIMDLTKFRNIQLSNIIIEGLMDKASVNANPTKRKKGVIHFTHPCDINAVYFEVKQYDPSSSYPNINALPINSLCAEFTFTTEMNISNIYGDAPSPFILKNVKLIMQFATPSSLYSKFNGNLVDASSENYKLVFVDAYYGGNLKTYGGNYDYYNPLNNNLPNNVFNKSVVTVNNGPIIDFDDTPPYIDIDLHEVKDIQDYSNTNKYKNILGIWNATISEKSTITYTTDLKWGNTLKLTSARADMLMRSGLQIFHNGLGLPVDSWVTVVLTLKADVKPSETEYNKYYFRSTGGPFPILIYGNRVKTQDSPFTIIRAFKITSGGYELLQIDSPHNDADKVVDINQEYTILDIAIFKGLHYGKCRSKFFTEP